MRIKHTWPALSLSLMFILTLSLASSAQTEESIDQEIVTSNELNTDNNINDEEIDIPEDNYREAIFANEEVNLELFREEANRDLDNAEMRLNELLSQGGDTSHLEVIFYKMESALNIDDHETFDKLTSDFETLYNEKLSDLEEFNQKIDEKFNDIENYILELKESEQNSDEINTLMEAFQRARANGTVDDLNAIMEMIDELQDNNRQEATTAQSI